MSLPEASQRVVAAAASRGLDIEVHEFPEGTKTSADAAAAVGKLIAERAKAVGVEKVAFDRSGFIFHGRVKALADAAREGGLDF